MTSFLLVFGRTVWIFIFRTEHLFVFRIGIEEMIELFGRYWILLYENVLKRWIQFNDWNYSIPFGNVVVSMSGKAPAPTKAHDIFITYVFIGERIFENINADPDFYIKPYLHAYCNIKRIPNDDFTERFRYTFLLCALFLFRVVENVWIIFKEFQWMNARFSCPFKPLSFINRKKNVFSKIMQ